MPELILKVCEDGERGPIRLQSQGGDILEIAYKAALLMGTIRVYEAMADSLQEEEDAEEPFPVLVADTQTLQKIIEWCHFYEKYSAVQASDKIESLRFPSKNIEDPDSTTEDGETPEESMDVDEDYGQTPEKVNPNGPDLKTGPPSCRLHLEEQCRQDVDAFSEEFFKVDKLMLFRILQTANFLDIESLLDAGAKVLADMIRGKETEEIKEILKI